MNKGKRSPTSSILGQQGAPGPPESTSPWLTRGREGALADGLAKRAMRGRHGLDCVPLKVPKLES